MDRFIKRLPQITIDMYIPEPVLARASLSSVVSSTVVESAVVLSAVVSGEVVLSTTPVK